MHNDCNDIVRQQISNLFPPDKCHQCATIMNETVGDSITVVTSRVPYTPLKGAKGEDIGAPKGWHVFTTTPQGTAWDNFGCHGTACDFADDLIKQNPGVQTHGPFNNSRSQIRGHSPVYWYSAQIWRLQGSQDNGSV